MWTYISAHAVPGHANSRHPGSSAAGTNPVPTPHAGGSLQTRLPHECCPATRHLLRRRKARPGLPGACLLSHSTWYTPGSPRLPAPRAGSARACSGVGVGCGTGERPLKAEVRYPGIPPAPPQMGPDTFATSPQGTFPNFLVVKIPPGSWVKMDRAGMPGVRPRPCLCY